MKQEDATASAEAQGETLDPEAVLVMEEVSLEEAGCGMWP